MKDYIYLSGKRGESSQYYNKCWLFKNMENIKITKSRRKTISLHIKPDGSVEMKAPVQMSKKQIQEFIDRKSDWLEKNLKAVQERNRKIAQNEPLTAEDIHTLADKALETIPERVAYFAEIIGVNYGRITIRNQKSRWGSCSGKGNLNFNCLLMLAPPEVLDYVVVHELCHRKEMNHSQKFWKEVAQILPDYKIQKEWLKKNGDEIMMRMLRQTD